MAIPDKFDPAPTVFTGGIERMKKLWEMSRDNNQGGYGGLVINKVAGWPPIANTTSCSPFTGTVIGMMFDPSGATDFATKYKPMCDGGAKPLPNDFYMLHNGFYFSVDDAPKNHDASQKLINARYALFKKNGWSAGKTNDSAGSCEFFGLGYRIDPRDMRKGDLVAIDWANKGGHATFCWDVHLDETGAVDCFQFLSANGGKLNGKFFGVGVSVSAPNDGTFVTGSDHNYTKVGTQFEDNPKYINKAYWYALPNVKGDAIELDTFKDPTPPANKIVWATKGWGTHYIASLRVIRFWGFPPPDAPHGNLLKGDDQQTAQKLAQQSGWPSPPSFASGKGTPPVGKIEKPPVVQQPKAHPDPVKATPPAPAPQKKEQVVAHQHFIESGLAELFQAKWIAKSPGASDSYTDAQTKAAVEDFQTKFEVEPIDGIPGPITRKALKKTLDDLHAGKRPPGQPDPKPKIDHFYWLSNRVDPGGGTGLAVHGLHLDLVTTFSVVITDQNNVSATLPLPLVAVNGAGAVPVTIPPQFKLGAVITARLKGSSSQGPLEKVSDVPLYVGPAVPPPPSDWPWDEALWTPKMRAVAAELRAARQGVGNFAKREITQYGVKEKIAPGDVPVLDKDGNELGRTDKRSLFLADIEGTMRLNGRMLNIHKSGNVYDQQVTKVIGGIPVKKPKPSLAKFDPQKSRWVDVTARAPWGMGARMPLIPFRVLAHNPKTETPLYGRIVYVKQLDGLVMQPTGEVHNGMCIVGDCGGMAPAGAQFDFFVGREDRHISIPTLAPSQGGAVCEVEILGVCAAFSKK